MRTSIEVDAVVNGAGVVLCLPDEEPAFEVPGRLFEQLPFAVYGLATVRLSHSDTSDDLKQLIEGRINALARVHGLFVQSRWTGAELHTLVTQELLPYLGEKYGSLSAADDHRTDGSVALDRVRRAARYAAHALRVWYEHYEKHNCRSAQR